MSGSVPASRRDGRAAALVSLAVSALLAPPALAAGVGVLPFAASLKGPAMVEEPADDGDLLELDELVVFGTDGRRVEGLRAETEMSVADVAGYGADNIGELLTQITA